MNDFEKLQIQKDCDEFLSKNNEKFEIISTLQKYLLNMKNEKYQECILFIQNHLSTFFNDHASAIFFYYNIIQCARFNFRNFELILDICVHFQSEMKKVKTTENELIMIGLFFSNSIFYLFSKNFFSIESIIKTSNYYTPLFIMFLPEIEEYDPEYARLIEQKIIKNYENTDLKNIVSFYKAVKSDPEKHIQNRKLNYHPSVLHKSIRNDDIGTFQAILSQNNYDINTKIEFSFYERLKTHDDDISLIQAAAVYGSLSIFKFLWMQKDIIYDDNLLKYAYCGSNPDIIHICENKCNPKFVYIEPIATQKFSYLDYFIENYSDQIIEYDDDVKSQIENFECDENEKFYSILDYEGLNMTVLAFNYQVLKDCLPKIAFISKNVELIDDYDYKRKKSLLKSAKYNMDLFEFIFSQKRKDVDIGNCGCLFKVIDHCLYSHINDGFKFLFSILKEKIDIYHIFWRSLLNNHEIFEFLIDLQMEEKESGQFENSVYGMLKDSINFDVLLGVISIYDEDILVKIIRLYDDLLDEDNIPIFIKNLKCSISHKMCESLIRRLSTFLPKDQINSMNHLFNIIS